MMSLLLFIIYLKKKYYSFRNTELYIWKLIASYKGIYLKEIILYCSEHYNVEYDYIEMDIIDFIENIFEKGLIVYE